MRSTSSVAPFFFLHGRLQSYIIDRNLRDNSAERTSQEDSIAESNLPAEQCGVEIPQSKPTVAIQMVIEG